MPTRSEWVKQGWITRRQNFGANGGIKGPPKIQFCPEGHDTFIFGRGKNGNCKRCTYIARRNWAKNNPLVLQKCRYKSDLKYKYGLTIEQHQKMIDNQNGRCAICDERKKLVIDHCHKTNKVRKLLCIGCNVAVGHFENHKEKIERYLQEHSNATSII